LLLPSYLPSLLLPILKRNCSHEIVLLLQASLLQLPALSVKYPASSSPFGLQAQLFLPEKASNV
jgi:hypothetical protein